MPPEADFVELVGRDPDERLLGEDLGNLPESVGRPEPMPESSARRRIVGTGAILTGVSLIGGLALIVLGVVEAIAGGSAAVIAGSLVLGLVLAGTHWGWVHVAELSANRLEGRRFSSELDGRRDWLGALEPYPHWEVSASTGEDGSISIVNVRYRPVASGEGKWMFVREAVAREVHSGDEPAATVAERAELLRRQAAADTARARERYEAAHEAYEHARLANADEQDRLAAVRAASEALSERINSNLRDPPLVE